MRLWWARLASHTVDTCTQKSHTCTPKPPLLWPLVCDLSFSSPPVKELGDVCHLSHFVRLLLWQPAIISALRGVAPRCQPHSKGNQKAFHQPYLRQNGGSGLVDVCFTSRLSLCFEYWPLHYLEMSTQGQVCILESFKISSGVICPVI